MPTWDPALYGRFAAERSRPFLDLLARIAPDPLPRTPGTPGTPGVPGAPPGWSPRTVVDLGCGPGHLTAMLAERWPTAQVVGLDSSPAMIERARGVFAARPPDVAGRLLATLSDIRQWVPQDPPDLLVSNAALQWVPGHLDLLAAWAALLPPSGVLAMQVPADFDAPLHAILRECMLAPRYAGTVGAVRDALAVHPTSVYTDVLARCGLEVDAWDTTYLHLLDPAGEFGDDAVLAWISGTGLRPVTDALAGDPPLRDAFLAEYATRLRDAYPRRTYGTPLAFHRVFVVARRPD